MKILYVLQGVPGSGKSSFIKENHLDPYTINLDTIRKMFSSPDAHLNKENHLETVMPTKDNKIVMDTFWGMLLNRFMNQQTTILDSVNLNSQNFRELVSFANEYLYTVKIVEIGKNLPYEELLYRNSQRGLYKIPEKKLRKFYDWSKQELFNKYIRLTPEEMLDDLHIKEIDITDKYEDFQVIGDIHSSASALKDLLENFSNKRLYVFCGDYFDRGIEPVETLRILQSLMKKDNTVFLYGNHDIHLLNYIYSKISTKNVFGLTNTLTGKDFKNGTMQAFEKENVTIKELKKFCNKLKDVFTFKFHDNHFLVSHAGLTNEQVLLKPRFKLQSSGFFIKGIGD